jgi:hypothetical protein
MNDRRRVPSSFSSLSYHKRHGTRVQARRVPLSYQTRAVQSAVIQTMVAFSNAGDLRDEGVVIRAWHCNVSTLRASTNKDGSSTQYGIVHCMLHYLESVFTGIAINGSSKGLPMCGPRNSQKQTRFVQPSNVELTPSRRTNALHLVNVMSAYARCWL